MDVNDTVNDFETASMRIQFMISSRHNAMFFLLQDPSVVVLCIT